MTCRTTAWCVVVLFAGCVESTSVVCGTDQVCPTGTTCSHLTAPDEDICASSDQISACASHAEGDPCTFRDPPLAGWCHDGVCIVSECGNLRLDPGELCDDGNTVTGDGTCAGDCSSTEQCGNGTIDPLARDENGAVLPNEECDDSNHVSGDGCSSTCKTELPRWSRLSEQPIPLEGSSMAYDPLRGRVVMFGGERDLQGSLSTNLIYEWNGTNWAHIATTAAPAVRRNAGLVYDAARRKIVMFGGQIFEPTAPLGDLWEWDGSHWTLINTVGGPSPRTKFGMVYDAARKKTVLFGGVAKTATGSFPVDETWEWDGATWAQINPATSPEPRFGQVMAYDPKRGVTVMAGGYYDPDPVLGSSTGVLVYRRDTWEYDGTTWRKVSGSAPTNLDDDATMAYDPVGSRMITFGGVTISGTKPNPTFTLSSKTWAFNGTTWTDLGQAQPGLRRAAAMVADPRAGKLVLFGGEDSSLNRLDNTYLWNGSQWSLATPFAMPERLFAASAHDPLRDVTWVFGGQDGTQAAKSELWSFDGTTWARHTAIGPSARSYAAMAFDPLLNQLVMFGGSANSVVSGGETWLFNGTTWSSVTPAMSPSRRFAAAAYFDPNRGRVVLSGGINTSNMSEQDFWEWTGTTWQPVTTSTGPTPRAAASTTFDHARGVGVLVGGVELATSGPSTLSDTWAFDGTTWTLKSAANQLPKRTFTPLVYDAATRTDVVFGGVSLSAGGFGDTWQWNGTMWQQVLTSENPPARGAHVLFPANNGHGVVLFGGSTETDSGGIQYSDTWQLRYENTQPVEQCLLSVDDDGDGLVGCADPDCWSRCTPLCPPEAATCDAAASRCGDGTCNAALESCRNCPQDCPTCTATCGDTYCDAPETLATCPGDCTP